MPLAVPVEAAGQAGGSEFPGDWRRASGTLSGCRRFTRIGSRPWIGGLFTSLWYSLSSGSRGVGHGGLGGVRAVEQRLAAQLLGDAAGLADRGRRGLVIAGAEQVGGVVEQAVGQVVGGGVLAQPGGRGCERRTGARVAVLGGEAGAGQVTFGAHQG